MEAGGIRSQTPPAMTDAAATDRPLGVTPAIATRPLHLTVLGRLTAPRGGGLIEAVALLVPILLVGITHGVDLRLWLAATAYLVVSASLAFAMPARSNRRAWAWTTVRILSAIAMVAAGQLLTGRTGLLSVVYLPIIALAAFAGPRFLATAVAASLGAHIGVESLDRGSVVEALQRATGFGGAAILAAMGTRREVGRMQHARDRLRRAVRVDRRRSRQIAGVEAIGRIVAESGPTPEAFDRVVDRIDSEFGYRCVSIYLGDERSVRLTAHRGYTELIDTFDGERGVVGRVMRTGRPAYVADVTREPDYWGLHDDVVSEICVPLTADGRFLGFINVESASRLDATDLRVMVAIADRLAASLAMARDRANLAERADLFHHLHLFSEAVNGTLQPDELYRSIVQAVPAVVAADVTALHVIDRASGRYLLAAVEGGDTTSLGTEARSGEGIAGRAIRDRAMVMDDGAAPLPAMRPVGLASPAEEPAAPMLAAAVPIIRDGAVLGALTLVRRDRADGFGDLDRDALAMLGEQIAMAITNVFLHSDVAELALRDPLTGLFNRRYLDPALEQLFARRARLPRDERVPLAAIMFDLDHFSELNNRHGHQVGDEVLRAFGAVLQSRMRSTDLVARFGGEEFAAILFRATLDDAVRIADEVREQLAATPVIGASGEELTATVSAGCAAIGPDGESPDALLRAADVALYMAKRGGRDRVCAA